MALKSPSTHLMLVYALDRHNIRKNIKNMVKIYFKINRLKKHFFKNESLLSLLELQIKTNRVYN